MQPPCFTACAHVTENGDQKLLFRAKGEITVKRHANGMVPTKPQLCLHIRQKDGVALF